MQEYEPVEDVGVSAEPEDSHETEPERRPGMSQEIQQQTPRPAGQEYTTETGRDPEEKPKEKPNREHLLYNLKKLAREKEEDASGSQAELAIIAKYVAALQAEISTLEKASEQIEPTMEAYTDAYDDLLAQAEDLERFADRKLTWAFTKLTRAEVKAIDDIRGGIDDRIEKARGDKETLGATPVLEPEGESVKAYEILLAQAEQKVKKAQDAFDKLVGLQQRFEKAIESAGELKKSIEDEEDKDSPDIQQMYVLLKDLKKLTSGENGHKGILKEIQEMDQTKLCDELAAKWTDLSKALEKKRDTEYVLNTARSNLDSATETFDDLTEKRLDRIFEEIRGTV